MKLFFLIRSLERGGAERQLVTLCNGLSKLGHEVHVVTFYAGGSLEQDLSGPHLYSLNKQGRWHTFGFLRRLVRLIREIRPDVAHGYLGTPNLLLALLKPLLQSTPIVWGVRASDMDLDHYSRLHRIHWKAEAMLSPLADCIIYNAEAGKIHAENAGFCTRARMVIPNGIDTQRFQPNLEARVRIRREWGVAEDAPLVGIVARLDPMKDHQTFLAAADQLAQTQNSIRFVCVGNGPLKKELEASARQYRLEDKLIWAGERQDMAGVYSALDLCCLTSAFGEGFPNVLGESMACCTPCVATRVGDSTQVLGATGRTVPPRDANALAEAVGHLLTLTPTQQVEQGHGARNHIKKHFSVEALIRQTEAALTKLC